MQSIQPEIMHLLFYKPANIGRTECINGLIERDFSQNLSFSSVLGRDILSPPCQS